MEKLTTAPAQALIVDDEPDIRELLQLTLGRMGIHCVAAADLHQARQALVTQRFDLCLTDMRLPDGDGITLVKRISARYPQLPVAVITAHGNMQTAIEAMKAGAFDFVSKPVDLTALRGLVQTALKLRVTTTAQDVTLLGETPAMLQLRRLIAKLARSQAPVFIIGESGTGKELVARLIHAQGPRSDGRFIAVNCGAIPHDLVESEFFGHHKGSFTGAITHQEGLFRAAHGGTLFLDEIADLPLNMQVKLLRAIQEKAVRPVGGSEELAVDARIISATHQNLAELVTAGTFRQDLFYRIHVIELPIPALRDRREDIPLLVAHFLARLATHHPTPAPRLQPAALQQLLAYSFPGNVRELENILERAATLCEDGVILPEDLQLTTSSVTPATVAGDAITLPLDVTEKQALQALLVDYARHPAVARTLGISMYALLHRLRALPSD